jgi:hypothetical protein
VQHHARLWKSAAVAQLTKFYAVGHPSWPNYAAFATGTNLGGTDAVNAGQFTQPDRLGSAHRRRRVVGRVR